MSSIPPDDDDDDASDDFLREIARVDERPPPSTARLEGTNIGRFKVVSEIGRGGMGIVFLAEDEKLRRKVALKLLPPSFAADEERRRRFLREARAAAAVSHPNLVTVYDVGEHEGRGYIAMEYLRGRSLREQLSERPLSVDEAVELARQVLAGLAHAHAAGLLHRDLKPENVLVDRDGRVRLVDFGLAKLDGDVEAPGDNSTRDGLVMGTPGYMSPEQARGQAVDARSDIFSFGVLLYEMLTRKRPFTGPTRADVVTSLLRDAPPRVDVARPEVGIALGDLVHRCLAKAPDDRFPSTAVLKDALEDAWTTSKREVRVTPTRSPPTARPCRCPRGDNGHWASGTQSGDQTAIMVPSIPAGITRPITLLDYAALADIGWQVGEVTSPPPVTTPPPTPPPSPPLVPPPPATANTVVRFAVGSGEGVASTVSAVNSDGAPIWTLTPFGDFTGGVRTATGDFDHDGVKDVVVGTGPGAATQVRIFSSATQQELFSLSPFEAAFTGGVYVAAGDITGDGVPELVVTPDEGGGPRARVFNGAGFTLIDDFFGIDDPNFRGGARAAVGDLNGDGHGDLLVSAGFGGGPRVAGYDGTSLGTNQRQKLFGDFFAFEQGLRNGIFIAAGDFNGDGRADLAAGGGPGGGPRVLILSGSSLLRNSIRTLGNFFAGDTSSRGGVRVSVDDVNADGTTDLITGSGSGAGSRVSVYNGSAVGLPFPFTLLDGDFYPGFTGGVFVG